jgi:hypothetical protein
MSCEQRATFGDDGFMRGCSEIGHAWKDDSEILPWLKQLATSNDDGLCAGPPFRKARKFASLEPAFAINRT